MAYQAVTITKGKNGWGGPLTIEPKKGKDIVLSVTGGGIHPVAQYIADLTGATAVDGFKTSAKDEETFCAVIDCGGTARCGVYPKKKVFTINLTPVGQSGPLAKFIVPELYVSGVKEANIELADGSAAPRPKAAAKPAPKAAAQKSTTKEAKPMSNGKDNIITRIGKGAGNVVGVFYQAGKDTIDMIIRNVLPFMAFVSMLIGIILETGIGDLIAQAVAPFSGNIFGLLMISVLASLPFLSPVLGPGAVIAQVVGVLIGVEIGNGNIPPAFALPALFAINPQVGADFIPVGLSLGEAEPETVEVGVPAILFSRMITGPASVVIAFLASVGLYS